MVMCELYNKIVKYGSSISNTCPHYEDEVSLTEVLFAVVYGIFITIFIVWQMIPLKRVSEYMNNVTFKCDKDKIRK